MKILNYFIFLNNTITQIACIKVSFNGGIPPREILVYFIYFNAGVKKAVKLFLLFLF